MNTPDRGALIKSYTGSSLIGILTSINEEVKSSNIGAEKKPGFTTHFNNIIEAVKLLSEHPKTEDMAPKPVDFNKLVKKPAIFDGINPNPRTWWENYEFSAVLNRWDDETKLTYFPAFLDKSAFEWYKMEVKDKITDVTALKEEFMRVYYNQASIARLGAEIEKKMHRFDEPVNSFISDMRSMLTTYDSSMLEIRMVEKICDKIHREN